ncbi:MAG TPA: hypothetical protein VN381_00840 [Anaerovoracaceae bacterium]|nr:hypothetical protein [Anaerovoracaceae bacterium]
MEEVSNEGRERAFRRLKQKLRNLDESTGMIRDIIQEYISLLDEVFLKIKSVQGIANKTNLLAINASIETIHASDLLASFEEIVTRNLFIQAKIIARILEHDPDFSLQDGAKFAKECGLEEFFITDDQGVVRFTNVPSWKNTTVNSQEMRRILKDPELEIVLPASGSGLDSEQYKVIGISRTDQVGIIQIGAHFTRPKGQLAIDGFGVVAQEAKRLAGVSREISTRITALTNELGERIKVLGKSFGAVQAGIAKNVDFADKLNARTAGGVLAEIRENLTQETKVNVAEFETNLTDTRKYFKDILSPLTELINIARQTNLLGVRAAIEAAHSTNDKTDFDNLLNRHMTTEAKLVAILIERWPDVKCEDMAVFTEYVGLDEIWIPNGDAVVELTNVPGGKGFRYVNEGQTAPYMRLLSNPGLVVTAPPEPRALDGKIFKYVGVERREKPGFVQIGKMSKLYGQSTAEGFAVVAEQIKNLADQSRETATEIEAAVEGMDLKAQKALDHIKSVQKSRLEAGFELEKIKESA